MIPEMRFEVNLGKIREIAFKNNQPPRPERTFVFISIITGRATPPSKGGDSYIINIQLIPGVCRRLDPIIK
jgi:hypothetical protein